MLRLSLLSEGWASVPYVIQSRRWATLFACP